MFEPGFLLSLLKSNDCIGYKLRGNKGEVG